jgi:hypothetical protein
VVAHDGWLDQARTVIIGTDRQHEHRVTRMLPDDSQRVN